MPGTGVARDGGDRRASHRELRRELYVPPGPDWPYAPCAGLVRRRDGVIEHLLAEDIDGDGRADAIVIVKSVGSGGYLSATAFAVDRESMRLPGEVHGPSSGADPVTALQESRQ